jgi:hypothetical protein
VISRATIDNSTLTISGTPTNSDLGTFPITLRAYDGYGGETFYYFDVEVLKNFVPTYNVSAKVILL